MEALIKINTTACLPNYSRYLGDPLGLSSALAQASLVNQSRMTGSFNNLVSTFREVLNEQNGQTDQPVDFLVGKSLKSKVSMRRYEIAAIAPDIFDAIFYSIEPNYGRTYLPKLQAIAQQLGISEKHLPRLDFGGSEAEPEFSIKDQMELAGATLSGGGFINSGQSMYRREAFWFLRDRAHLLTSWVHNDVIADFINFPEERYGKCQEWDDEYKVKIPGSCLYKGGRTGYSVKIISGDFLRAKNVQYGGENERGGLLNPPPRPWPSQGP